ncbi:MAG: hypothetical protein V9G29_15030 [Burkholderiaceae bacterium]
MAATLPATPYDKNNMERSDPMGTPPTRASIVALGRHGVFRVWPMGRRC